MEWNVDVDNRQIPQFPLPLPLHFPIFHCLVRLSMERCHCNPGTRRVKLLYCLLLASLPACQLASSTQLTPIIDSVILPLPACTPRRLGMRLKASPCCARSRQFATRRDSRISFASIGSDGNIHHQNEDDESLMYNDTITIPPRFSSCRTDVIVNHGLTEQFVPPTPRLIMSGRTRA